MSEVSDKEDMQPVTIRCFEYHLYFWKGDKSKMEDNT